MYCIQTASDKEMMGDDVERDDRLGAAERR